MIDLETAINALKVLSLKENSNLRFEIYDSVFFVSPLSAKQFIYVVFHNKLN